MQISLAPGVDWKAPTENVLAVLHSVCISFLGAFDGPSDLKIVVTQQHPYPVAAYAKTDSGENIVGLTVTGLYWAQYAYQFSHELCHLVCNTKQHGTTRFLWFEEVLCELASLFTLPRMSDLWMVHPPYMEWRAFAPNFTTYIHDLVSTVSPIRSIPRWIKENEGLLSNDGVNRAKNRELAHALLPLFRARPMLWVSVTQLNLWDYDQNSSFDEFLTSWSIVSKQRNCDCATELIAHLRGLTGEDSR